ncbi:MAG: DUF881 domain-containing protein [Clostridia bacterium]|nr:DUF881 domain-containing protein [Clostridia bacterium]
MKKGEITITITISLMCLILTTVIFVQFKTINQTDITTLENMREDELRTEISNFKQKAVEIEEQLKTTNLKIKEYQETINTDKKASELLAEELEQQNNILGKNDVSGSGIILTLTDTRAQKITSEDLRQLLNQLRADGAEAISINGQRIVYDSYVVDLGGTFISVNGERLVSPYEVKVIGNPTYLESGLSKKQYGYIDTKLEQGKDVVLERKDKILINAYKGNLNMEYAKEAE